MSGSCDTLADWLNYEVGRQQEAFNAVNEATVNRGLAIASLAAATTWAGSCAFLLPNPVAFAICEVPAAAAIAAAALAVNYYNNKVNEATAAYTAISAAIQALEGLLADCQVAEADGRGDDVDNDIAAANVAFDQAEAVVIPVVDQGPINDANAAVAAAEEAVGEAQAADASTTTTSRPKAARKR